MQSKLNQVNLQTTFYNPYLSFFKINSIIRKLMDNRLQPLRTQLKKNEIKKNKIKNYLSYDPLKNEKKDVDDDDDDFNNFPFLKNISSPSTPSTPSNYSLPKSLLHYDHYQTNQINHIIFNTLPHHRNYSSILMSEIIAGTDISILPSVLSESLFLTSLCTSNQCDSSNNLLGEIHILKSFSLTPIVSPTSPIVSPTLVSIDKLMNTEHFPESNTCIIFDWDDTLLASYYLTQKEKEKDEQDNFDEQTLNELNTLSKVLIDLLELAGKLGSVCIITNSEHGWVELSCKKYIPSVWDTLQKYTIISARSAYHLFEEEAEPLQNDQSYKWKFRAFCKRLKQNYKHLLAFGDGPYDHEVAFDVGKKLKEIQYVKIVRLIQTPTVSQLYNQLACILNLLVNLHSQENDAQLMLITTNKTNSNHPPPPPPPPPATPPQPSPLLLDEQN